METFRKGKLFPFGSVWKICRSYSFAREPLYPLLTQMEGFEPKKQPKSADYKNSFVHGTVRAGCSECSTDVTDKGVKSCYILILDNTKINMTRSPAAGLL